MSEHDAGSQNGSSESSNDSLNGGLESDSNCV